MLTFRRTTGDTPKQTDWIGPAPWIVTPPPGPMALHAEARSVHRQMPVPSSNRLLVMQRAQGSIIEDVDGNRYLDFTAGNGTCLVGHCHPQVTAAIESQAHAFLHALPGDAIDPLVNELAERLCRLAPIAGTKRAHVAASGEAALEAAIRMVRSQTGRSTVIVFRPRPQSSSQFVPGTSMHRCLRGPLAPQLAYGDINAVKSLLETSVRPETVAAVLVEPMMTKCGHIDPPAEFLPALRELCDTHRMLMIADERRTGLGRTGALWACSHLGVQPDVLVLGEALSSGMPIGAVVMPSAVTQWPGDGGSEATSAQPLSCAAALACLELIEKQYTANTSMLSPVMQRKLETVCRRQKCLSSPRGRGLLWTLDVVCNGRSRLPQPELRDTILTEAYRRGVLLQHCGPSAVRFQPPLSINRVQIEVGLDVFEEAVATVAC